MQTLIHFDLIQTGFQKSLIADIHTANSSECIEERPGSSLTIQSQITKGISITQKGLVMIILPCLYLSHFIHVNCLSDAFSVCIAVSQPCCLNRVD